MSETVLSQANGTPDAQAPSVGQATGEAQGEWPDIRHACDDPSETSAGGSARDRLVALDVARGVALVGMIAVHTISSEDEQGDLSLAWALASGKSSALFALLGGVGIAFLTGRQQVPRGRAWARASAVPVTRGLVVLLAGLLLGAFTHTEDANIVLPYLGLMFLIATLLLPLHTRDLLVLGIGWAVLGPVLSHVARQHLEPWRMGNATAVDLVQQPADVGWGLLFTGFFPAFTWMAYIAIGMAVGRADLSRRRSAVGFAALGAVLALGANAVATMALGQRWVIDDLGAAVEGRLALEEFTSTLVWGAEGVLPTNSWWWLLVNAPHTGSPVDMLFTIGVSLIVIGLFLGLVRVFPGRYRLLAAPGSMTLTLYSLHVAFLALAAPHRSSLEEVPDLVLFAAHMLLLTVFAVAWSRRWRRGPLEWLMWRITGLVRSRPSPAMPPTPTSRQLRSV